MGLPSIQAGDVLGYHGHGIFSSLIRLKTWAPPPGVSHVELANSPVSAFASRDGKGVSTYALDTTDRLVIVWRPKVALHMAAVRAFHHQCLGQSYDVWGLFRFFTWGKQSLDKQFCSEYCLRLLRAGGCCPFQGAIDADLVAPWQFALSTELEEVWRRPS